jgi:hypothetical protein
LQKVRRSFAIAGTLFTVWAATHIQTAFAEGPSSLPDFHTVPLPSSSSHDLTPPALKLSQPEDQLVGVKKANHQNTLMWGGLYLAASLSALVIFPPDNWHGNIIPHPDQMARSWT